MKMRWFMSLVLLMPQVVLAGPNAGGTLVVHDANLLLSATDGSVSICMQGSAPDSCQTIDIELNGSDSSSQKVWKVYATFPKDSSPRLIGITWGIQYVDSLLGISLSGKCGDFELNDEGWPGSGTGSSVTWDTVQTAQIVPIYWFGGYQYTVTATTFELTAHPSQGGYFGDDTAPANLDPVADYGRLGFGMAGYLPCPGDGEQDNIPDSPPDEAPENGGEPVPEETGVVKAVYRQPR